MPGSDYIDGRAPRTARQPARRKPSRKLSAFGRWVAKASRLTLVLVVCALLLSLIGVALMYSAYAMVKQNIERLVNIDLPQSSQATRIYARDYNAETGRGTLLALIFDQNRKNVSYSEFPPELIACLLSTEDKNFYDHHGVDFPGTARAVARSVSRGSITDARGTSTLTQQLARNVFLPFIRGERQLSRKVQEFILAGALEKRFTKPEIIEAYLNHVYFGSHAYGAHMASQTYFSKSLNKLTLGEAALLAGLPQAPSAYDPYKHPKRAEARRRQVLTLLKTRVNTNFIARLRHEDPDKFKDFKLTAKDVEDALAEKPITKLAKQKPDRYMRAHYFVDWLNTNYLAEKYGGEENIKRQGLIVVTTIDPTIQKWADETMRANIDRDRRAKDVSQGAVIVLEAKTGEVLACTGGYKWLEKNVKGPMAGKPDMYNRAIGKGRQTGSSFKPFTYATAYEQGFPPTLMLYDGPYAPETKRTGKPWPKNSDHKYLGVMPMYRAMQNSRNAAAVDLICNVTGIPAVIEMANRMGIDKERLPEVPSLTLGVVDIAPLDMAEAYDTFPNYGAHVRSIYVKKIYNQNGVLLEDNEGKGALEERSNPAFSPQTGWQMVRNMQLNVNQGTGTAARVSGVEIGGKTGTCDDFGDAWFCGYSPEIVCTVWVGNDDFNDKMVRMFGGNTPAKTFQGIMSKIYGEGGISRYKLRKFAQPDGTTFATNGPRVGMPRGVADPAAAAKKKAAEEAKNKAEQEAGAGGSGDEGRWDPPSDGHVFF
ncbi:MAG: transglycosylase domain-containing protein [bacterium]|nr:transglycosylase domain-containing protein [bacterium]